MRCDFFEVISIGGDSFVRTNEIISDARVAENFSFVSITRFNTVAHVRTSGAAKLDLTGGKPKCFAPMVKLEKGDYTIFYKKRKVKINHYIN